MLMSIRGSGRACGIGSGLVMSMQTIGICARAVVCMLALALVLPMTGCSGSGQTGANSDYVKAFKSGRYSTSYELASKATARGSGAQREQAALIAGLSAHALNRDAEAVKFLTPLPKSADKKIAGDAGAALGLIAVEKSEYAKAAELLTAAGRNLEGDSAGRAFMYAGDAYKSMGKTTEARGMWSLAQTKVPDDSALRVLIGDRLNASAGRGPGLATQPGVQPQAGGGETRWSVQVGAFSSFTNAQKQLGRFKAWGLPRVVEMNKGGKQLFAVRVGIYTTRAEADRIKASIGKEATIVTTADEM